MGIDNAVTAAAMTEPDSYVLGSQYQVRSIWSP